MRLPKETTPAPNGMYVFLLATAIVLCAAALLGGHTDVALVCGGMAAYVALSWFIVRSRRGRRRGRRR